MEANWIKEALKDSWSAVATINFLYADTCPFPSATNWVDVTWNREFSWEVSQTSELGMRGPTKMKLGYCDTSDCLSTDIVKYKKHFVPRVIREFGHALGFANEQQRNDVPQDATCPTPEPVLAGGIKVTPYFDRASVMQACRPEDAPERLSAGDIWGVQRVYGPPRMAYWQLPPLQARLF